jgi:hypothetical protein
MSVNIEQLQDSIMIKPSWINCGRGLLDDREGCPMRLPLPILLGSTYSAVNDKLKKQSTNSCCFQVRKDVITVIISLNTFFQISKGSSFMDLPIKPNPKSSTPLTQELSLKY